MKLVTTKFKSGGLHEKHVVATWNLGNHLSICLILLCLALINAKQSTTKKTESTNADTNQFVKEKQSRYRP
jgi:hypothetical protein